MPNPRARRTDLVVSHLDPIGAASDSESPTIGPVNTPAHIILSAVVLGRGRFYKHWIAITGGALLPDVPMFGFYLFERLVVGHPERLIWSQLYFDPDWQRFFDLFNSLPLIAFGLAFAAYRRSGPAIAFFLSMTLHVAGDLPVHREDAHGHFYPLSDWRFESPVSYWDPEYHGLLFGGLELLGVIVGSWLLIRRGRPWRRVGVATLFVYGLFIAFAIVYWLRP